MITHKKHKSIEKSKKYLGFNKKMKVAGIGQQQPFPQPGLFQGFRDSQKHQKDFLMTIK
jgi:hypothetical protein